MGNKRAASEFHPASPPRPVSKRMRGPSGHPLVTTPPRPTAAPAQSVAPSASYNSLPVTPTAPHRTPSSPPPPLPSSPPPLPRYGTEAARPASLPVTPARPPRMPRFDRDRAADAATDRKLVQRLHCLSPSEIVALVKDVEQRLRQLTAFETEEINRAKRLGFSQASRHSSPVAVHPPPLQAAW